MADREENSPLAIRSGTPLTEMMGTAGESSGTTHTLATISSVGTYKRIFSLYELFCLFAVSFSYAFIFNTLTNIVIPKEVEQLAPVRQSIWVGLIMSAGAICQLATPIVGSWSDRAAQRIPYLIYGSIVVIIGIVLFLVVGQVRNVLMLFVAHIVTTIGLSVQYAMVTALLNDHVAEEQVGKGSAVMANLAILGSGAGYAMFATGTPLHYSLTSYILATVFCLGICVIYVPPEGIILQQQHHIKSEHPHGKTANPVPRPTTHKVDYAIVAPSADVVVGKAPARILDFVAHALSIPSPSRHPDFFFACLGRCLFNSGLAGQVYLVYYVRDILGSKDAVRDTSLLSVAALLGGVVGALPSGILSDKVGKKPVIYIAIVVCIVSLICFLMAPDVYVMQAVGFIYGCGNIAYLSVDYALGVQALPRKVVHSRDDDSDSERSTSRVPMDAAKDLGVFAMSATVGQLLGQVMYGAVLDQYSTSTPKGTTQFNHSGFVMIYGLGALFFALSGLSTSFIRSVR